MARKKKVGIEQHRIPLEKLEKRLSGTRRTPVLVRALCAEWRRHSDSPQIRDAIERFLFFGENVSKPEASDTVSVFLEYVPDPDAETLLSWSGKDPDGRIFEGFDKISSGWSGSPLSMHPEAVRAFIRKFPFVNPSYMAWDGPELKKTVEAIIDKFPIPESETYGDAVEKTSKLIADYGTRLETAVLLKLLSKMSPENALDALSRSSFFETWYYAPPLSVSMTLGVEELISGAVGRANSGHVKKSLVANALLKLVARSETETPEGYESDNKTKDLETRKRLFDVSFGALLSLGWGPSMTELLIMLEPSGGRRSKFLQERKNELLKAIIDSGETAPLRTALFNGRYYDEKTVTETARRVAPSFLNGKIDSNAAIILGGLYSMGDFPPEILPDILEKMEHADIETLLSNNYLNTLANACRRLLAEDGGVKPWRAILSRCSGVLFEKLEAGVREAGELEKTNPVQAGKMFDKLSRFAHWIYAVDAFSGPDENGVFFSEKLREILYGEGGVSLASHLVSNSNIETRDTMCLRSGLERLTSKEDAPDVPFEHILPAVGTVVGNFASGRGTSSDAVAILTAAERAAKRSGPDACRRLFETLCHEQGEYAPAKEKENVVQVLKEYSGRALDDFLDFHGNGFSLDDAEFQKNVVSMFSLYRKQVPEKSGIRLFEKCSEVVVKNTESHATGKLLYNMLDYAHETSKGPSREFGSAYEAVLALSDESRGRVLSKFLKETTWKGTFTSMAIRIAMDLMETSKRNAEWANILDDEDPFWILTGAYTLDVSGEWPGRAVADTARLLVDADVTGGVSKFFVEEAAGKGGGTNFLGRLTPSENEEILSSAATRLIRFGTHTARSILDDSKLFILSMYADKKYADEKVMENLNSIGRGKVEGARHWVETKNAFSTRELTSFAEVMGKTQFPPLARPTRTGRNTALDAEGFVSKLRRHLEENRNAESVEAHVRLTSGCLSRFVTENAKVGYMEEYVSAIVSAVASVSEEAPPDGDEIPVL